MMPMMSDGLSSVQGAGGLSRGGLRSALPAASCGNRLLYTGASIAGCRRRTWPARSKLSTSHESNIESALGNGMHELERCNATVSACASKIKCVWENRFSRHTFLCLDILKEWSLPSSDLVLFSPDSTMA